MDFLNDWHDYVRVLLVVVLVYTLGVLTNRFVRAHKLWNEKTLDYWYAMVMWCIAGVILLIQGVKFDYGFTPGFVLLIAATLVTGRGVHRKGDWGSRA